MPAASSYGSKNPKEMSKATLPRALAGSGTASSARFGLVLSLTTAACLSHAQTAEEAGPTKMKPTTVIGAGDGLHDVASESELVGPARQPEWTARRAFVETDVYVIPTGEFEFNQFYILSNPRHGKPENIFETELELGLPWRTQFDVEMNYRIEAGAFVYDSTMIELPHALADWGKLPLNPAVDIGWRFRADEADSYVARLLLADQITEKINFGANLSFERQVSGELETDYELSAAVNYRLVESKLAVGAQLVVEYETGREREYDLIDNEWETEHEYSTQVLLGPSLLYRPTRNVYVGVTPLFGLTRDSPMVETFFLVGFDWDSLFGGGAEPVEDLPRLAPLKRPK
jgi:hypothetical protein